MKTCPFCAEEIQDAAIVCKHCGRDLVPPVFVPPTLPQPIVYPTQPDWNPGIAALLSFFIPGVGQIYKGQAGRGVGFLFGAIFGYLLFILPGVIVHLIAIFDAASNPTTAPAVPAHLGGVTCVECKTPGHRATNYCIACGHVFGTAIGSKKVEVVACVECKTPGVKTTNHCLRCGHVFGTPAGSQRIKVGV